MLINFRCVSDGSLWYCDTDRLRYCRASKPIQEITEGDSVVEEFGKLKLVSPILEMYSLDGRTPTTEAPGKGLSTIGVITRVIGDQLYIYLESNVKIKESTCISPINGVRCEVIGG